MQTAGPSISAIDGQLLDGLCFCTKVYELFESIRATDDGRSRLRMRASAVEKKLVEELLPICKYIQTKYRAGRYISIRWVSGNQQFDAEARQCGSYVDHGMTFPQRTLDRGSPKENHSADALLPLQSERIFP